MMSKLKEVIKTLRKMQEVSEREVYKYMADDLEIVEQQFSKEQADLELAVKALQKSVDAAKFFMKFADCNRDSWYCRCEFCRDTHSSINLREADQTLKQIKEKKDE